MKLITVLSNAFNGCDLEIRRKVSNSVIREIYLKDVKVSINEDDTGYDIILESKLTGHTWELDPDCDFIKITNKPN